VDRVVTINDERVVEKQLFAGTNAADGTDNKLELAFSA